MRFYRVLCKRERVPLSRAKSVTGERHTVVPRIGPQRAMSTGTPRLHDGGMIFVSPQRVTRRRRGIPKTRAGRGEVTLIPPNIPVRPATVRSQPPTTTCCVGQPITAARGQRSSARCSCRCPALASLGARARRIEKKQGEASWRLSTLGAFTGLGRTRALRGAVSFTHRTTLTALTAVVACGARVPSGFRVEDQATQSPRRRFED